MGNTPSLARVNHIIESYKKFVGLLPLGHSSEINGNLKLSYIVTTSIGIPVMKINLYGLNELTETGTTAFDFISTKFVLPVNIADALIELSTQTEEYQRNWCKLQLKYKLTEIVTHANKSLVNAISMKSTATTITSYETATGLTDAENTFKKAWNSVSKATDDVRIVEKKLNTVLCDKTATLVDHDYAYEEHREVSKTMNVANITLATARNALDVARQLMNPTKVITDCEDRICAMNAVIARVSDMLESLKI